MSNVGYATMQVIPSLRGIQGQITGQLGGVSKAGDKAGKSLGGRLVGSVGKVLGAGVAVVGATAGGVLGTALYKGFGRLTAIEDAKASLTGLGHSAKDVKGIMGSALASVKGTAFGLGDAATVAASTVAAGIKPGKQLTHTLKLVADAATIGKTSMGEMGAIFNKVAAQNKAYNGTLQQLSDRGIPIYQQLAKVMHTTPAEVAKLAAKGKVDFATFQKAMESMSGAALKSGTTTSGSLANVGAAVGRLGAALEGGVFSHAPKILGNLITIIDNITTAVTPAATAIGDRLGGSLERLTGRLAKVDFTKVVAGIRGLFRLVSAGDYSGDLRKAFGLEEDSRLVSVILTVRNALIGAFKAIKGYLSGLDFSSWQGFLASLKGSGGVGSYLSGIGKSIQTLMPAVREFVAQLPQIGPAAAKLGSAGIQVLSKVLGFLAAHVDTLIKYMPLLVAGFVAWRVASAASATASQAVMAANIARTPVLLANNILRLKAATLENRTALATTRSTAATTANNTANRVGLLTRLRGVAAMVAQKTALIAGAAATKIAAAGQWLLNAAMTANPIGIVIVAVAALTAGLIWFFTKTKIGQKILTVAWAGIKKAVSAVAKWFSGTLWPGIKRVWNAIIKVNDQLWDTAKRVWRAIKDTIATILSTIRRTNDRIWNGIRSSISRVWNGIRSAVSGAVNAVRSIISRVLSAVRATNSRIWNGVRTTVSGVWNSIRSTVSGAISRVRSAVSSGLGRVVSTVRSLPGRVIGALSGLASRMFSIGSSLIGRLVSGIWSKIGAVANAAAGIANRIKGFFGGSPVEWGPLLAWNNGGVGRNLGGMLAQGLLDSRDEVGSAADQLAARVTAPVAAPAVGVRRGGPGTGGGDGAVTPEALRRALNGLKIDLANGRLYFDEFFGDTARDAEVVF